jgi:O-antigen ligase
MEAPEIHHSAHPAIAADRWPPRVAAHVLGLGLLTATLIVLPAAPSDLDRFQLPKETVVHLAVWLAVWLTRPLPAASFRPAARTALAGFVITTVLAAFGAANGWLAFRAVALTITAVAALLTARRLAAAGQGDILLHWCGLAAVCGAVTGLAQAYGASNRLFTTLRAPGGTFGNRNFVAHFSALGLMLLMFRLLSARRRLVFAASAAGVVITSAAVVISRSRAAWLGASIGVAVLVVALIIAHRQGRCRLAGVRVAIIASALVAGAAGAILVPNQLAWRASSPYADTLARLADATSGSGRGRMLQYRHSLTLVRQHPILGVGPANWPLAYPTVAPADDPSWSYSDPTPFNPWPSSDWIALVSERGVLGLVMVILLGVAVGWRGLRASRQTGPQVLAGAVLLALLTTIALQGAFDAVLLLPAPVLLSAMAVGALLHQVDGEVGVAPVPQRPAWNVALLIVLGLGAVRSSEQTVAYIVAGNGASSSRLEWAAHIDPASYPIRIALARRLPCARARGHIRAALQLAPTWPAPRAEVHRCGVSP